MPRRSRAVKGHRSKSAGRGNRMGCRSDPIAIVQEAATGEAEFRPDMPQTPLLPEVGKLGGENKILSIQDLKDAAATAGYCRGQDKPRRGLRTGGASRDGGNESWRDCARGRDIQHQASVEGGSLGRSGAGPRSADRMDELKVDRDGRCVYPGNAGVSSTVDLEAAPAPGRSGVRGVEGNDEGGATTSSHAQDRSQWHRGRAVRRQALSSERGQRFARLPPPLGVERKSSCHWAELRRG